MSYLAKAIHHLRPGSQFVFQNEDYSTIEWHVLEGEAPTASEVISAIEIVKEQEAAAEAEKAATKAALLDRLGITEDEARLLLS